MLDMQLQDQTETNIYCVTSFCRFTINQGAPTQLNKYFHRRADVWAEHGLLQLAYQYLFSDATEHLSVQHKICRKHKFPFITWWVLYEWFCSCSTKKPKYKLHRVEPIQRRRVLLKNKRPFLLYIMCIFCCIISTISSYSACNFDQKKENVMRMQTLHGNTHLLGLRDNQFTWQQRAKNIWAALKISEEREKRGSSASTHLSVQASRWR